MRVVIGVSQNHRSILHEKLRLLLFNVMVLVKVFERNVGVVINRGTEKRSRDVSLRVRPRDFRGINSVPILEHNLLIDKTGRELSLVSVELLQMLVAFESRFLLGIRFGQMSPTAFLLINVANFISQVRLVVIAFLLSHANVLVLRSSAPRVTAAFGRRRVVITIRLRVSIRTDLGIIGKRVIDDHRGVVSIVPALIGRNVDGRWSSPHFLGRFVDGMSGNQQLRVLPRKLVGNFNVTRPVVELRVGTR